MPGMSQLVTGITNCPYIAGYSCIKMQQPACRVILIISNSL